MATPLPEFERPPVIEVALSVQFEKLDALGIPQLGIIWQCFRDRFPKTEIQPPLEPAHEYFGPKLAGLPMVRFELQTTPGVPRLWAIDANDCEVVQVQQDRFMRNWRKHGDAETYPRYKQIRENFLRDFQEFETVTGRENLGKIVPNQCELTYVNIISAHEASGKGQAALEDVLTVFSDKFSDDFLWTPEEASVNMKFAISGESSDSPAGRLHVSANPVRRMKDNTPAIRLSLVARGRPEGDGIEGVMRFLDRGHEMIVRAFASITSPVMHEIWGRTS